MTADDLLRVRDLSTRFFTEEGQVNAVEGVSFTVRENEILGIVGESGSGKSVTALSVVDLVESPGRVTDGEVWYRNSDLAEEFRDGRPGVVDGDYVDVLGLPVGVRRALRGSNFSMIFQDATSSFNPSITVGEQIAEAVEVQRRARANPRSTRSRTQGYGLAQFFVDGLVPGGSYADRESHDRAVELLEQVGIPDPAQRAEEYPHQFSGGMLQRAMVAQALAGEPDLLIADEPTTALDVTIQAQILNLLERLQAERGMSVLLITHNLGVVARTCDRVGVMYAGEVVERGTLSDVFENAVHPYTRGLLGSIPDLDDPAPRLSPIEGNVHDLVDAEMGERCYFADRCPKAMEACLSKPPEFPVDGESGETDAGGSGGFDFGDRGGDGEHAAKCYLAEHPSDESQALPEGYFDEEEAAPGAARQSESPGAAHDPREGEVDD